MTCDVILQFAALVSRLKSNWFQLSESDSFKVGVVANDSPDLQFWLKN